MENRIDFAPRAIRHLRRRDPVLRPIIAQVGPFAPRRANNRFAALVGSIISQQISTKAADSIHRRLLEAVGSEDVTAEKILSLRTPRLRRIGLSKQKAAYLRDLSRHVTDGLVDLESIHELDDESVIQQLVQVKGIGRWTAEMFLMFSLVRPDVLPVDDLGLRAALKRCDGLAELPTKAQVRERGAIWAPFRSVATWYLWQSLRIARGEK
jgi:DNA-3-methyladenine glycosylase II